MKLLLIPIEQTLWNSSQMVSYVEQATDAARRIRKKIDIRHERLRFSLACESIESLAIQNANITTASIELEGAQAYAISCLFPKDGNIVFTFCGSSHLKEIKSKLPGEITSKINLTGGLVIALDPYKNQFFPEPKIDSSNRKIDTSKPEPDYSLCGIDLSSSNDDEILRRTHMQIRRAIETGETLGWLNVEESSGSFRTGLARHSVLVKALREYINLKEHPCAKKMIKVEKEVPDKEAIAIKESKWWFKLLRNILPLKLFHSIPMKAIVVDEMIKEYLPIKPIYIRISYKDGSVGEPFPLFCLPLIKRPTELPVIRAALISCRHFPLDCEVDICLLRNSEISLHEDSSIADQERLAYDKSIKLIQGCIKELNGLELHLYHTGLEPAIIGSYRAIVDTLRLPSFRGRFMVIPKIPKYEAGDGYLDLKSWY